MAGLSDEKSTLNSSKIYQVRIKGHLGQHWNDGFMEMTITQEKDGCSLLTGPVADQAALHGLLKKFRDLGVALISVQQVESSQPEKTAAMPLDLNINMKRRKK